MKRAQRGAPLVIPAETFNAFVDVALDHQRRQRGVGRTGQREQPQTGIILIRNESGAARARFDVLGIAGPIIKPSDNADAFKERVALRGVTPAAEHAGRFVVLTEPLATGAIGRAYADGICPVRVEMVDENLGFAEVEAGTVDTLQSASGGSAGLLWVQPVEERDHPAIAWTVARIGGGGSPSGGMSAFCKITGSVGASAPFAYSGTEQEFS
ncbi:MAG: hypothetical protein GY842_27510, partial [bacterium]|nr:hypothetical protein [bacterium]